MAAHSHWAVRVALRHPDGSFKKIPVVGIPPLPSLADCSLAPSVPAARWKLQVRVPSVPAARRKLQVIIKSVPSVPAAKSKLQVSLSVLSLSTPPRGGFFSFDFMAGLVTGLKLLQEFTSQIHWDMSDSCGNQWNVLPLKLGFLLPLTLCCSHLMDVVFRMYSTVTLI